MKPGARSSGRVEAAGIARVLKLLSEGEIELRGLVPWSSNYTFLALVKDDDLETLAVYKPERGERPLWDFRTGTLCRREAASYRVSQSLGWPSIPPVVLRDGPHGVGSVQLYVDADPNEHYFTLSRSGSYEDAFRRIALFDFLVNNADRKGGHVLKGEEGEIWAIDHGLTFHVDYKLRTVIWEYASQRIPTELIDAVDCFCQQLQPEEGELAHALLNMIDRSELAALKRRAEQLLEQGTFPRPMPAWRNTPYPAV